MKDDESWTLLMTIPLLTNPWSTNVALLVSRQSVEHRSNLPSSSTNELVRLQYNLPHLPLFPQKPGVPLLQGGTLFGFPNECVVPELQLLWSKINALCLIIPKSLKLKRTLRSTKRKESWLWLCFLQPMKTKEQVPHTTWVNPTDTSDTKEYITVWFHLLEAVKQATVTVVIEIT